LTFVATLDFVGVSSSSTAGVVHVRRQIACKAKMTAIMRANTQKRGRVSDELRQRIGRLQWADLRLYEHVLALRQRRGWGE